MSTLLTEEQQIINVQVTDPKYAAKHNKYMDYYEGDRYYFLLFLKVVSIL